MNPPRRASLAFLSLLLLTACDPISIMDGDAVEVLIEGEPGVTVRTIISQNFGFASGDFSGQVVLVDADTAWVPVEHRAIFDLRARRQFFIRILDIDPARQFVTVSVWLDGVLQFHRHDDLTEGHIQYVFVGY